MTVAVPPRLAFRSLSSIVLFVLLLARTGSLSLLLGVCSASEEGYESRDGEKRHVGNLKWSVVLLSLAIHPYGKIWLRNRLRGQLRFPLSLIPGLRDVYNYTVVSPNRDTGY